MSSCRRSRLSLTRTYHQRFQLEDRARRIAQKHLSWKPFSFSPGMSVKTFGGLMHVRVRIASISLVAYLGAVAGCGDDIPRQQNGGSGGSVGGSSAGSGGGTGGGT